VIEELFNSHIHIRVYAYPKAVATPNQPPPYSSL
jgi:hypothetical protein